MSVVKHLQDPQTSRRQWSRGGLLGYDFDGGLPSSAPFAVESGHEGLGVARSCGRAGG